MKIIHICLAGSYNINWGYQDNIIPKYNKLAGHDVSVITSVFIDSRKKNGYEKVEPGKYYSDEGVKVLRIPFKKRLFPVVSEKLRIYEGLYKILENEAPDFIFMHGIQFLDMNVVVKYVKNFPNCLLVADNHASYENSGKNFLSRNILHKFLYKNTIQKSLKYIRKIYSITPGCQKFAKEMYSIPDDKMEYLYLGADIGNVTLKMKREIKTSTRQQLELLENDFIIITGGKLNKDKNVGLLIDSFLSVNNDNIKLIIFGEFTDDVKDEMLKKIKLDKRIIYLGWQNQEQIYKLYLSSDLAVFPGTQSALWQQAIACGLPIIIKKWYGVEYLDLGGNCIFLEADSLLSGVSDAIMHLINDKKSYNKMRKVAEEKGIQTFSYKEISKKAISL